ncbi:Ornithine decarboxylase [Triticum urartu]|uniref:Ornithine decarboxylase n=2 Tax=Triticum TaxID=4564 RepID=A0A9R0Z547_TRITD|nr:Ornithine decarboxylase [Triticum urartu]VAI71538.1 unnamed protein product [Triticum turgidum subsp. durum]
MAGGSAMQAVLAAPGVKGRKVRAFKGSEKDAVAGVVRSIAGTEEQGAFFVFDLAKVVDLYSGWGDWLVFDGIGAYAASSGSNFNGFLISDIKTHLAYST